MDVFLHLFYSLKQNNIGPNFGDGLNIVTCEQGINSE